MRRASLVGDASTGSMPSFSTHFKVRVEGVSERRNEKAQRHLSMVRLGALKHHAKVLRHRENKVLRDAERAEQAHAKAVARERRRRALEKAATLANAALVDDLVAKDKLVAIPKDADPNRVVVKYCPVTGYETVHKKLSAKKLKPILRADDGPQPHDRHVLRRDRMAEAALAEKCHGVPMCRRLFSHHHAHQSHFGDRNFSVAEVEAARRDGELTPPLVDHGEKVVIKDAVPRYRKKVYLDTKNEMEVMKHMEKYIKHRKKDSLLAEIRAREEAETVAALDDMDRFAEHVETQEKQHAKELPPVVGGSAWQRLPQNQLPTWAVDTTVYLGA